MVKFTFLFRKKQRDLLEQRAEKKDRSVSYIIRKLIDAQFNDQERKGGDQDEDSN